MESSAPNRTTPFATIEWSLEKRPHGRLDLIDAQGRIHADVDVLRAFPVSDPLGPVAIVGDNDAELAWIESLATVEPRLRAMLEEELGRREFLPVIERIEAISEGEPAEWSVVTDRGSHRFRVGHADDILRLPDSSALVTDTFGLRYAIPSIARLDARSRRLLERAE
jgi:hypothetical protein